MIEIYTGLPGSGKSTLLARTALRILRRNEKWYKNQVKNWQSMKVPSAGLELPKPARRVLYTNLKLSDRIMDRYAEGIGSWVDLRELLPLRDVDVLIDEVATYFDSRQFQTLSTEMRRWLQQHRKFGIEIFGTAQDFAQVDIAFRRLTSRLLYIRKLIGTRDISPTRPAPRFVFVLSMTYDLDPTIYDEQKSKFAIKSALPVPMLITKDDVTVFDTRAEVLASKPIPLKHIMRVCELNECPYKSVQHT